MYPSQSLVFVSTPSFLLLRLDSSTKRKTGCFRGMVSMIGCDIATFFVPGVQKVQTGSVEGVFRTPREKLKRGQFSVGDQSLMGVSFVDREGLGSSPLH